MSDPSNRPQLTPAPPAAPLPTDQVRPFGKYVLVRKLAEGGMAEIFLAKQIGAEGFERNVVIKRMLQNLSNVPDFVGMFLDEARLAARLSHQNIVQINDLGLADGCYYICMEYLAGEDFSTVLRTAGRRREYVPISVVCRVIIEAAHGLHFAHEFTDESGNALGVVHRDISPSNIYVTFQGQVKVLDFGIAKAESRVTHTTAGVVKGKYMYMAPEQARGAVVDRRADVFSLGVSLYEALTNTRPFSRDNDLAILNAVLRCDFKPPRQLRPDLPLELEQIVLKAMAPTVEQRYASAQQMAADLEKFLASQTSSTGGGQVAQYVRALFGEERVTSKTRIPTMQSLAPMGMPLPGFNPDAKTQAGAGPALTPSGGVMVTGGPTRAGPLPGGSRSDSGTQLAVSGGGGRGVGVIVGSIAASAVIAAAAVFGLLKMTGNSGSPASQDPAPASVSAPAVPVTSAAVIPVEGTGSTVTAGAEAESDAGIQVASAQTEAQTGEGPGEEKPTRNTRPVTRTKPVQLDATAISKVVSRGTGPIMKCFESYKADLPSDQGRVLVKFTIVSSGKVSASEVQGALNNTQVGNCVAKNVSRLKFPAHTDQEITLTQAFGYTVQR